MIAIQYTFFDMMMIIYFLKKILLLRTTGSTKRRKRKKGPKAFDCFGMCGRNDYRNKAYLHKEEQVNGMDCEFTNVLHND